MYESLKNLILHRAYATREDAEARVRKAYPKWITEGQRDAIMALAAESYGNANALETEECP